MYSYYESNYKAMFLNAIFRESDCIFNWPETGAMWEVPKVVSRLSYK